MNSTGDFVAGLLLIAAIVALPFLFFKCDDQSHRHSQEKRAQCFEATKNPNCFYELSREAEIRGKK